MHICLKCFHEHLFANITLKSNLFIVYNCGGSPLIHPSLVEGVLGLGEREHSPFQWPPVSLVTRETMQILIGFVKQRKFNPTLETNKQTKVYNCIQKSRISDHIILKSTLEDAFALLGFIQLLIQ